MESRQLLLAAESPKGWQGRAFKRHANAAIVNDSTSRC